MIKFEKKYLYCFADVEEAKKLIGKKGIFFDNCINDSHLKSLVLDELIGISDGTVWKGLFFESIVGYFRFFYYDPNLEVKRAYYLENKKIQFKIPNSNKWTNFKDGEEPSWLDVNEYRIKPKETHLTNRQVAEWLAKGNGQVLYLGNVMGDIYYGDGQDNKPCKEQIRKWSDSEWHEPTKEYIEDEE